MDIKVFTLDDNQHVINAIKDLLTISGSNLSIEFTIKEIYEAQKPETLFHQLSNNFSGACLLFLDGDLGRLQPKGHEYIESIRKVCPNIVIISHSMDDANRQKALELGADAAYSKEHFDEFANFWVILNELLLRKF